MWGLTFNEYQKANKEAGVSTVEDEEEFNDIVKPGLQAQLRHVYEEGEKVGDYVHFDCGEIAETSPQIGPETDAILIPIDAWQKLAKEAGP